MTQLDHLALLQEAEQYKLQAEFILHSLQANMQVYKSNSAWTGATPADIPLALKYVNRALEHFPDNPAYLNLKALLLIESGTDASGGIKLLERAAELSPRDITIQDNLEKLKANQNAACFIATAAYGTPEMAEVRELRRWRDRTLLQSSAGRVFVKQYYRLSPPIARLVSQNGIARSLVRLSLRPILALVRRRLES